MPVYTYQCEECGVRFDLKQSFSDAPVSVCPECGGATHKVIQPVGVVFKGSGFYVTDNRSQRANLTSTAKKDGDNKPDAGKSEASTAVSKKESTPAV